MFDTVQQWRTALLREQGLKEGRVEKDSPLCCFEVAGKRYTGYFLHICSCPQEGTVGSCEPVFEGRSEGRDLELLCS